MMVVLLLLLLMVMVVVVVMLMKMIYLNLIISLNPFLLYGLLKQFYG